MTEVKPQAAGTNRGLLLFLAAIAIWVVEKVALKVSISQESPLLCTLTIYGCLLLNIVLLCACVSVIVRRNQIVPRPSLLGAVVAGLWALVKLVVMGMMMAQ